MLDLVPLTRARRKVRDVDAQPQVIGQTLQRGFPAPRAIAVTAARIGGDIEGVRGGGYAWRPIIVHHCLIDATAKAGVSWWRPTLTQALFRAMSYMPSPTARPDCRDGHPTSRRVGRSREEGTPLSRHMNLHDTNANTARAPTRACENTGTEAGRRAREVTRACVCRFRPQTVG